MIDDAFHNVLNFLDKIDNKYAINNEYIDKYQLVHLVLLQQLVFDIEDVRRSLDDINDNLKDINLTLENIDENTCPNIDRD